MFIYDSDPSEKETILNLLTHDITSSSWIDGYSRIVRLRRKAIIDIIDWLEKVIINDADFNNESNGKIQMVQLFYDIQRVINSEPHNCCEHFTHFV